MRGRKGIPAQIIKEYQFEQMDSFAFKPGEPLHDCLVLRLSQSGLTTLLNSILLETIKPGFVTNPPEHIEVRIYGKIVG